MVAARYLTTSQNGTWCGCISSSSREGGRADFIGGGMARRVLTDSPKFLEFTCAANFCGHIQSFVQSELVG
jgi:hypothetical protein